MKIEHHVAEGATGDLVKDVHDIFPTIQKGLQEKILHPSWSRGTLEGHDVVSLLVNDLGVFLPREHVLTQVEHCDVAMVGMFGKEVQDLFVVAPFGHQVV